MKKRTCYIPTVLAVLWLAVLVMGCTVNIKAKTPTATANDDSLLADPKLAIKIGDILTGGGWEGKNVTVMGYYRGWDLLGEVGQAPPVTKSDWVIKDDSGAIYIQANSVEIKGQEKLTGSDAIRPDNKGATSHVLIVTGVVHITQAKQYYIEPTYIVVEK